MHDFAQRNDVAIATKLHGKMREGPNGAGLSRKAILSEIDRSLQRLGTEYVDLYQIHRWDCISLALTEAASNRAPRGATKISHLEVAIGALSITLPQREFAYLEAPYTLHPIVGHE